MARLALGLAGSRPPTGIFLCSDLGLGFGAGKRRGILLRGSLLPPPEGALSTSVPTLLGTLFPNLNSNGRTLSLETVLFCDFPGGLPVPGSGLLLITAMGTIP